MRKRDNNTDNNEYKQFHQMKLFLWLQDIQKAFELEILYAWRGKIFAISYMWMRLQHGQGWVLFLGLCLKEIPTLQYFEVNNLLIYFTVYTIGADKVMLPCLVCMNLTISFKLMLEIGCGLSLPITSGGCGLNLSISSELFNSRLWIDHYFKQSQILE